MNRKFLIYKETVLNFLIRQKGDIINSKKLIFLLEFLLLNPDFSKYEVKTKKHISIVQSTIPKKISNNIKSLKKKISTIFSTFGSSKLKPYSCKKTSRPKIQFNRHLVFLLNFLTEKKIFIYSSVHYLKLLWLIFLKQKNFNKINEAFVEKFFHNMHPSQKHQKFLTGKSFLNNYFFIAQNLIFKKHFSKFFFYLGSKLFQGKIFSDEILKLNKEISSKKKTIRKISFGFENKKIFFLSLTGFKENIEKLFSFKNQIRPISNKITINFLSSLLLSKNEINFLANYLYIKNKNNFNINQILLIITKFILVKGNLKIRKNYINILFHLLKLCFDKIPDSFEKYILIFFHRLKEYVLSQIKSTHEDKIMKDIYNQSSFVDFNGKFKRRAKKNFFCEICLLKSFRQIYKKNNVLTTLCSNFNMFLENKIKPRSNLNLNSFFFFATIIEMIIYKNDKHNENKSTFRNFKKLSILLQKILGKRFSSNLNEIIILHTIMKRIDKSPGKFLFLIFLKTRRLFFKILNREVKKNELRTVTNKDKNHVVSVSELFLLNFLFEYSEKINTLKTFNTKSEEVLMIIGPNRDFLSSNSKIETFKKSKKQLEKKIESQEKCIINLFHLSRSKKKIFLKHFLYSHLINKNSLKSRKISLKCNKLYFKSMDKKLCRLFLFIEFKYKKVFTGALDSIFKNFYFEQIYKNPENFYEKSSHFFTYSNRDLKKCSNKKNIIKKEKESFELLDKFYSTSFRDTTTPLLSTKNTNGFFKICKIKKNIEEYTLNFFIENLIFLINKSSIKNNLFMQLCFYLLFSSFLMDAVNKKKIRKASYIILNIVEKSTKNDFLFIKNKSIGLFKYCYVRFSQIKLITKIKRNIYKNTEILDSSLVNKLIKKKNIRCDFSEYPQLYTIRVIKRAL